MASEYYKPCKELEQCEALDQYWEKKQFDKFFRRVFENCRRDQLSSGTMSGGILLFRGNRS